jgi:hypothetical protein
VCNLDFAAKVRLSVSATAALPRQAHGKDRVLEPTAGKVAASKIERLNPLGRIFVMGVLKVARNILGTAGLLLAGYVLLMSLKDSARYIRISSM